MRIDVMDVAEDRTAASQKRRGQSGEWPTNVAGKMMNALLSPRSSDPDHWWASIHHQLLSTSYARGLDGCKYKTCQLTTFFSGYFLTFTQRGTG